MFVETASDTHYLLSSYQMFMCVCHVWLQLEEEEAEDSFDVDVAVTNPEKVGQSAFKVMIQLCLISSLFRLQIRLCKFFTLLSLQSK